MPATPEEITEITRLINSCADMLKYLGEVRKEIEAERAELKHVAQEEWQIPVLQNGWVAYGDRYSIPAYFKDSLGIVHIKGLIRQGITETDTVLFNLPVEYRSAGTEHHPVCVSPGVHGQIRIETNGTVVIDFVTSNLWLALDGITFRAA